MTIFRYDRCNAFYKNLESVNTKFELYRSGVASSCSVLFIFTTKSFQKNCLTWQRSVVSFSIDDYRVQIKSIGGKFTKLRVFLYKSYERFAADFLVFQTLKRFPATQHITSKSQHWSFKNFENCIQYSLNVVFSSTISFNKENLTVSLSPS